MRIDILTLHPELLKSPFEHSILQRAIQKKIVDIQLHNIRFYSNDKHKKVTTINLVGVGMVMCIQPIADCIDQLKSERDYDAIIYMTPDGERLEQSKLTTTLLLKTSLYSADITRVLTNGLEIIT